MKWVDKLIESIIVCNDLLAINLLKKSLKSTGKIKIVGTYAHDIQIINEIEQLNPRVAFVIIETSGKNGIKTAERIKEKLSNIEIVFISKYEQYAVEAYEIGAVDYILMPFNQERICKTVNRLPIKTVSEPIKDLYTVCCFKNLHFKCNGKEIKKVKWRTAKAKELFTLLVQNREETMVRKDVLVESLWPEQDVEKAYEQLYCTIYQIRTTLKSIGINIKIVSSVNGYELVFNDVKCDVDEWEKGIKTLPVITEKTLPDAYELIEQYVGDYLTEETYTWKENEQERLRVIYQSFSNRVLNYLCETQRYTEASLLALRNQKLYPYLQDSYFMLMRIYDKHGDLYNVEKQYFKLVEMLKEEFNTIPSQYIRDWYKGWLEKQKTADSHLKETVRI